MKSKVSDAFVSGQGARMLVNLLVSGDLVHDADAPAAAYVPQRRHLSDVLQVVPIGPGVVSVPRAVAQFIAAVQSSEGNAAQDNPGADLELVRQPFAQVLATVTASRQILDDSALVAVTIDGELREALRTAADTELARMLAEFAPLHTVAGSSDLIPAIVESLFAFGKRWGAPRAIILDHASLETNAVELIAAAPGVVSFDGDALRIGGVPVIGADLAEAGEAIITAGTILQREGESVVSNRMHGDNFVSNKVTLLASTRLAAIGPSLRVAI